MIRAAPTLRNDDAERAVLGRCLVDAAAYHEMSDRITAASFADPRHAAIFAGIKALVDGGRAVTGALLRAQVGDNAGDTISLATYLPGLTAYASELAGVPTTQLADAVAHHAGRRDLIAAADRIRDRATGAALDTPLAALRAEAQAQLAGHDEIHYARRIGAIVSDVVATANTAVTTARPFGIRSGFKAFDHLVGPLLPGQLIIIGGETSSGKTALAMQVGYLMARAGHTVSITSLEMTGAELATRYLVKFSGVATERIIDANLSQGDLDAMMVAGEGLYDLPLSIDDQPRQNVAMLHARTAREVAEGCGLKIVDHLQYVCPDDPRAQEREQIRQVVDDIKAMAKRLGIPVILLSHVTRRPSEEFRPVNQASDIRLPTLNILYGSSAIEKAADAVVFAHRPIWFLERNKPLPKFAGEHAADKLTWAGRAQLVLAKRRMGRGHGIRECGFDEATTWFSDDEEFGL